MESLLLKSKKLEKKKLSDPMKLFSLVCFINSYYFSSLFSWLLYSFDNYVVKVNNFRCVVSIQICVLLVSSDGTIYYRGYNPLVT